METKEAAVIYSTSRSLYPSVSIPPRVLFGLQRLRIISRHVHDEIRVTDHKIVTCIAPDHATYVMAEPVKVLAELVRSPSHLIRSQLRHPRPHIFSRRSRPWGSRSVYVSLRVATVIIISEDGHGLMNHSSPAVRFGHLPAEWQIELTHIT